VRSVASDTHDRDDLFDLGRIGRVAQTPVWNAGNVAGDRRSTARHATPGEIRAR
jgi:hypothetical protein